MTRTGKSLRKAPVRPAKAKHGVHSRRHRSTKARMSRAKSLSPPLKELDRNGEPAKAVCRASTERANPMNGSLSRRRHHSHPGHRVSRHRSYWPPAQPPPWFPGRSGRPGQRCGHDTEQFPARSGNDVVPRQPAERPRLITTPNSRGPASSSAAPAAMGRCWSGTIRATGATRSFLSTVGICCVRLSSACAQQAEVSKPAFVTSDIVTERATVLAVNRPERMVVLRGEDGGTLGLILDERVRNLGPDPGR